MEKGGKRSRELSTVARKIMMVSQGAKFEKESTYDFSPFFGDRAYGYCMEFKLSSLDWHFSG